MKFYEYSAKELFRSEGIPVPEGSVARTPRRYLRSLRILTQRLPSRHRS